MTSEAFAAAREEIEGYLEERLAPLRQLATEVAAAIGAASGAPTEADLADLVPLMRQRLETDPVMIGYGYAAAAGVIEERQRYLLWFQRRAGSIRRLNLNLADGDPDLYDYFDTDWFGHAERDLAPAVYGPYVDYAGADFLVLTAAVPVVVEGRFVGVAGADMDPGRVERALMAAMRGLPDEAVIVAADRSVMAAGSARWMPGERLRVHPAQEPERWRDIAPLPSWVGWTLAAGQLSGR